MIVCAVSGSVDVWLNNIPEIARPLRRMIVSTRVSYGTVPIRSASRLHGLIQVPGGIAYLEAGDLSTSLHTPFLLLASTGRQSCLRCRRQHQGPKLSSLSPSTMEELQKKWRRRRKRKHPPEKPADETAAAADNGTSHCVETYLPAQLEFLDAGPEEVRIDCVIFSNYRRIE